MAGKQQLRKKIENAKELINLIIQEYIDFRNYFHSFYVMDYNLGLLTEFVSGL